MTDKPSNQGVRGRGLTWRRGTEASSYASRARQQALTRGASGTEADDLGRIVVIRKIDEEGKPAAGSIARSQLALGAGQVFGHGQNLSSTGPQQQDVRAGHDSFYRVMRRA